MGCQFEEAETHRNLDRPSFHLILSFSLSLFFTVLSTLPPTFPSLYRIAIVCFHVYPFPFFLSRNYPQQRLHHRFARAGPLNLEEQEFSGERLALNGRGIKQNSGR
eukprot:RCo016082